MSRDQTRPHAARIVGQFLKKPVKLSELMDRLPDVLPAPARAAILRIVAGYLRHRSRLEAKLERTVSRSPRRQAQALLLCAAFELEAANPAEHPLTVDAWVDTAKATLSKPEAGFINAVLRRWSREDPLDRAPIDPPVSLSCPPWLWKRWRAQFGDEATEQLAHWQLEPPPVYLAMHHPDTRPVQASSFSATRWPGFFELRGSLGAALEEIRAGRGVIRDPFTQYPLDLLSPQQGENILDACAAPGGKASWILAQLKQGHLHATDRAGPRLDRLRETLDQAVSTASNTVEAIDWDDPLPPEWESRRFHAILLDAPCSNTGVLRRRPDAKWRLQPADIDRCREKQLQLLGRLAPLLHPGGRLVYSTCSLETVENQQLVEIFLASREGRDLQLTDFHISLPWREQCDGGGAFLLRRKPV